MTSDGRRGTEQTLTDGGAANETLPQEILGKTSGLDPVKAAKRTIRSDARERVELRSDGDHEPIGGA